MKGRDVVMLKSADSDNERYHKKFESFQSQGYTDENYANVLDDEDRINVKVAKFKRYADYVPLFFTMLKDSYSGKYPDLPKRTIASVLETLLYIFSPFDLVLDSLPLIGLFDDMLILAICIKATKCDVDKYRQWREEQPRLLGSCL